MNKKTIIVIILLAAAVFIAWRKGWFAKTGKAIEVIDTPNRSTPDDTDSIINATSMTELEKDRCRQWVKTINQAMKNGTWSISKTSDSAVSNGITFNKQLVCDAVWQMYATQKLFGREYADKINNEIKNM